LEQTMMLQEIFKSADEAHQVLESLEPSLGSRPVANSKPTSSADAAGDDDDNNQESAKRGQADKAYLPALCSAVIEMWGKSIRASARGRVHEAVTRGIPQRLRFLMHQMVALGVAPTIQDHNRAIEAWAFSKEHMRASQAERIFEDMQGAKPPMGDAESRRLMFWAWGLSHERRAAYRATGHLMKMFRSLQDSDHDEHAVFSGNIEPSLSDYHVVLRAWSKAE
jgi:hypothetical protein